MSTHKAEIKRITTHQLREMKNRGEKNCHAFLLEVVFINFICHALDLLLHLARIQY